MYRAIAGMVAGLCAGVVTGIMLLMMSLPDLDGASVPLLTVVSRAVGYNSPAVGWSFHLFVCTSLGMLFGFFPGRLAGSMLKSIALGLATSLAFWFFAGLMVLPSLLGRPAFAVLSTPALKPATVGTLIGSIVYGVLLGAVFYILYEPIYTEERRRQEQEAAGQQERELVGQRR